MSLFDALTANLPVLSSGEEETARQEQFSRLSARKPRKRPLQPAHKKRKLEPRPDTKQLNLPDTVEPLSALVALDPKLCVNAKQQSASAAADRENPLQAVTLQQLMDAHAALLGSVHIAQPMWQAEPVDVKTAVTGLQDGTRSLSFVHADVESVLLGEAGTFEMLGKMQGAKRTFPPCIGGKDQCVMSRDWGFVGRSWMTDEEFVRFMSRGEPLPPQRPCILCCRAIVEDIVCSVDSSDGTVKIDPATALLQQYANYKECPGGYKSEYMQLHPADDGAYRGVFGPMVAYQKSFLFAATDDSQINCDGTKQPARMIRQDIMHQIPLRSETPEDITDYASGLLVDIRRVFSRPEDAGRVVCQMTLPRIHSAVFERVFKRALGANRTEIRHLLFKSWPIRCWTRKFWTVLTRFFKKTPAVEVYVSRLVLCSLLGNYVHTGPEEKRPQLQLRRKLYGFLDARGHRRQYRSEESVRWRKQLVERCPRVYLHAIQELMCTDVADSPVLLRHVRNLMQFDAFFSIVKDINRQIRDTILASPDSPDYDTLSEKLEKTRMRILKVSYDQPHLQFLEYLREVRSFAKPSAQAWFKNLGDNGKELAEFQTQGYAKPSSEISNCVRRATHAGGEEDSEEDEEESQHLSQAERDPTSLDVLIEQAVQDGLARASNRDAAAVASRPGVEVIPITSMQITMEHSRVLEAFVETFDPRCTSPDDAFWTVSRLLHMFGCTRLAASELQFLWIEYKLVKKAKDRWKSRMLLYSARHPYAYALIHATRRFLARHRQFQTYPLPANIRALQCDALRKKWDCAPFQEAMRFCVCPCCRTANTLVRSEATPKLNNIEGLRGVQTNISTGEVFCGRSVVFGHRQCGAADQPLLRIDLEGKWVGYKQRGLILCCHCGHPTRMEPDNCIFDDHGLACVNCTEELRSKQGSVWRLEFPELVKPEDYKCFLCNKPLATAKKGHDFVFLAKDAFACYRHHAGDMDKLVDAVEAEVKQQNLLNHFGSDAKKVQQIVLKKLRELKDAKEKGNRSRNDYRLKLQKRADARNQRR